MAKYALWTAFDVVGAEMSVLWVQWNFLTDHEPPCPRFWTLQGVPIDHQAYLSS